jgi:hypothetical protein
MLGIAQSQVTETEASHIAHIGQPLTHCRDAPQRRAPSLDSTPVGRLT